MSLRRRQLDADWNLLRVVRRGSAAVGEAVLVVILIGKTYKVTCDMPFAVVGRSDVAIDVIQESETELVICRPVEIYAEEVQTRGGASFSMVVSPNWLGGHFAWTNGCCSLSTDGGIFTYSCRETCTCTGCSALGYCAYENYRLPANGGACDCIGAPEGCVDVEGEDDGPYDAGASVSFSKHAIIFEDRYENTPGVWVERQSTRTELHCVAHGGPNGGHVRFEIVGEEKLDRVAGVRAFPVGQDVGPGMKLEFFITYRGLQPSDSANDIVVTSTFTENVQGAQTEVGEEMLTCVKVELTAVYDAPENHCSHRHVYGVGEKVTFDTTPSLSGVSMRVVKADTADNVTSYDTFDGVLEVVGSTSTYKCPAVGTTPNIAVSYLDAEHNPDLSIVEPRLVVTTNATGIGFFSLGDVVMGTLKTVNYIGPMDVSFQGVKVVERLCSNAIPPVGCFATTNYTGHHTHTVDAGAGVVHPIGGGNYWTVDEAGRSIPYVNWSAGQLAWKSPNWVEAHDVRW